MNILCENITARSVAGNIYRGNITLILVWTHTCPNRTAVTAGVLESLIGLSSRNLSVNGMIDDCMSMRSWKVGHDILTPDGHTMLMDAL